MAGCGRSQEAEVRAALEAKFPGGGRQCFPLSPDTVGIHVSLPQGATLFYPSTGPTAPTHHLFVFYAGRADQPVPELVRLLAEQGLLRKEQVEATIDVETSGEGPLTITKAGWHTHGTLYHHAVSTFPVDIYLTARSDPHLNYDVHTAVHDVAYRAENFPSRAFSNALPPDGEHYVISTISPYALSVVTAACVQETVTAVSDVKTVHGWLGTPATQATVTYSEDVPPWMTTPAFSRVASGPRQGAFGAPRQATILFTQGEDGKLTYMEEERP